MKKRNITIKEAKEIWKKLGNNEFILTVFPIFNAYWNECKRINNLPEKEWQDLVKRNKKKLSTLTKR